MFVPQNQHQLQPQAQQATNSHHGRQSSQRRTGGSSKAQMPSSNHRATTNNTSGGATQIFGAQNNQKASTFTPNLNLYSNYLMNQQAIALSPTGLNNNGPKQQPSQHQPNYAGQLLNVAKSSSSNANNASVRLKKMATNNQQHHHTAGSRTRPKLADTNTTQQQQQPQYLMSNKLSNSSAVMMDHHQQNLHRNNKSLTLQQHSNVQLQSPSATLGSQSHVPPQLIAKATRQGGQDRGQAGQHPQLISTMLMNNNKQHQRTAEGFMTSLSPGQASIPQSLNGGVGNNDQGTKSSPLGVYQSSQQSHLNNGTAVFKSNTASPDTTVIISMRHSQKQQQQAQKQSNGPEPDKIKVVEKGTPVSSLQQNAVDQVYLIGGNIEKRGHTSGTTHRQTKTIFDYNNQMAVGGSSHQTTSGNFMFQPVLKSPPGKAPSVQQPPQQQTFKQQQNQASQQAVGVQPPNKKTAAVAKRLNNNNHPVSNRVTTQGQGRGGTQAGSGRGSSVRGSYGRGSQRRGESKGRGSNSSNTKRSMSRKGSSASSGGKGGFQTVPSQQQNEHFQERDDYQQFYASGGTSRNGKSNQNEPVIGVKTKFDRGSRESLSMAQQLQYQMSSLTKNTLTGGQFCDNQNGTAEKMSSNNDQTATLNNNDGSEVNNSAINNYMQTFSVGSANYPLLQQVVIAKKDGSGTPEGGEAMLSMKQLVTSPTAISGGNTGTAEVINSRMQHEFMAMMVERNIQTAGGQRVRPTLKSNLVQAQNTAVNTGGRQKFVKRHNKFVNNVSSAHGANSDNTTGGQRTIGQRSGQPSRSPSANRVQQTNFNKNDNSGATVRLNQENSSAVVPDCDQESNLIMTNMQTSQCMEQIPADFYSTHGGGVLTPELLHSKPIDHKAEIIYHKPNQQAMMLKDQQQTYFTSDSHEKLGSGPQIMQQQKNGSFKIQGSPRASYYSPQRNQSQSKNLWLNDTIPVASPQRQTLTPSQPKKISSNYNSKTQGGNSNSSGSKQANSKNVKTTKSNLVGVTQLGTSYDFNKIKKGLDSVEHRNNQNNAATLAQTQTTMSNHDQPLQAKIIHSQQQDPNADTDKQKNKSGEEVKKQEKDKPQTITKVAVPDQTKRTAAAEEVIVFSENHSMDDYIVGKEIGKGAYATVHIGVHKRYNKKVALKIYVKEKMKDLQRKKSVRREIKLMKRLDHPNIAKLYDAIETETKVILVMEYVGGGSTHGFLKSKPNRQMEESEAKKIFSQLISALNYLHSKCIAHRDIKLENVMLDHRGNVKLIDFGFSTQIPNTQKIKLFCGTPSYMAPEIVKKIEFCGPPADIYASGVLLFAFFCGCFPYRGKDDKDLYKKIANDDLVIPDHVPLSPKLFIARMLQKDPEHRPCSQDLYDEPWVQSGIFSNRSIKEKQQTRSNSIKRRNHNSYNQQQQASNYNEKGSKPTSPSYIPGQHKVMTPLSDHKVQQHQQILTTGLVYDQKRGVQTHALQHQNNNRPTAQHQYHHRGVVSPSDSSARSTKQSFTATRGNVRSPRDNVIINGNNSGAGVGSTPLYQQFQRASEGGSASARGYSQQTQQRINKKRMMQNTATKEATDSHQNQTKNNMTMNLSGGGAIASNRLTLETEPIATSEIPFIVTKHDGQTVTYGGSGMVPALYHNNQKPAKPSTPVNIGRYYTTAASGNLSNSHHTFRGGKPTTAAGNRGKKQMMKINTTAVVGDNRATMTTLIEKERDEGTSPIAISRGGASGPKVITTMRKTVTATGAARRQDLVVDKHDMVVQANASRGDTINSCKNPVASRDSAALSPTGTTASHLSPTSDRFPGRKKSGPASFYNSEAYKAYYTHSAANNASNSTVGLQQQQQAASPNLNIAQEGPLLPGQGGATSPGANGHQTINNNINIINYITTVACSHPSHEEHKQSLHVGQQSNPPQKTSPKNNWVGTAASPSNNAGAPHLSNVVKADNTVGVYGPTGKAIQANNNIKNNSTIAASIAKSPH